jgi:hypothetical protein
MRHQTEIVNNQLLFLHRSHFLPESADKPGFFFGRQSFLKRIIV